jgi:Tfp pilus assembly protein PilV
MPSIEKRRGQAGVSLVESVVASALMGIGVVAGLTAWDTAAAGAERSVRLAWANCIVRSEADAILSASYSDGYEAPSPFDTDDTVQVVVDSVRSQQVDQGLPGDEELVTVRALDPQSRRVLAQVSFVKSRALAGSENIASTFSDVKLGCPAR